MPYDPTVVPDAATAAVNSQKLLVPYDTYVQLWNAAHPDQRLQVTPPVVPYAWSGASYTTKLTGDEALEVNGSFQLDLFSDSGVTIPLSLSGGVLQSLTVDGKPGRLQLVEPAAEAPPQAPPGAASQLPMPAPKPNLMLLHVSGKGLKEIKLTVRMKIERRGGWRVIEGHLPRRQLPT